MKNQLISVVIPAFNEEKRIGEAINAVLDQTYPHIEIIVVNNNSTDSTVSIVEKFLSDHRVRLVHEQKQGLIYARQRGLDHVRGHIFAQLDADCIPAKDWIATAVPYFSNPGVSGVTGPYYYYDAPWYLRLLTALSQHLFFGIISWYVQKKKTGAILIGGNAFIRTIALEAAGGYNQNLEFYGEDTDTASRIARHGRVVYKHTLSMPTSFRRFKDVGFWNLQKKYNKAFLTIIRGRSISVGDTLEGVSPR